MKIYKRKGSPNYYYRFMYKGKVYRGSTDIDDAETAKSIMAKKYTEVVEDRHLDIKKPKDVPTLKNYSDTYLTGHAEGKRTKGNDQSILKKSIVPAFGRKRLDEISPKDVERWRNARLKAPKLRGEGTMSPASVRLEMALLKTIMGLAVRDGLIDANPVSLVRLPKVNNARDRVITPGEYRRLLKKVTAKAKHMRPIVVLAYETGMRRGEILGLRWKDLKRRSGFACQGSRKLPPCDLQNSPPL